MLIPRETAFISGTTASHPDIPEVPIFNDFIAAPELQRLGEAVRKNKLSHLGLDAQEREDILRIDYRWKHKGGSSGGNPVLGKCVKLSGAAKHYAGGAHFLVWLAADHCESEGFDEGQIEALLYHELLHIERVEREDKHGNVVITWRTVGHDFEGFYNELQEYGAWHRGWQALETVVRQLPLPMEVTV